MSRRPPPEPARQRRVRDAGKGHAKGRVETPGITYAQLAKKREALGAGEKERNLNNRISWCGITAGFRLQCLVAIGASPLRLSDA